MTWPGDTTLIIRHRQTLFDVVANASEVATAVGLPPISDEVAQMERKASMERLRKVEMYGRVIDDHTKWLAAIFCFSHKADALEHGVELPDEQWVTHSEMIRSMLLPTSMSLLALLVDVGAVHIDEKWKSPEQASEQVSEDDGG
jgi:hypothetical protein